MADQQRRGGIIFVKVNGERIDAKGNFTWDLGVPQREAVVGSDEVHGYMERPKVAFIEGELTDRGSLDLEALFRTTNATVTLELATGKVVILRNAWYAGDGVGNSEEGNVGVRFEGASGEELPA